MPDEAENERRTQGNVIMGADVGNLLAGFAKADQQPKRWGRRLAAKSAASTIHPVHSEGKSWCR
jgi:hypothetical protein